MVNESVNKVNSDFCKDYLTRHGVKFAEINPILFVIPTADSMVDFWPSTGTWRTRSNARFPASGNTVKELVDYLTSSDLI